MRLRVDFVAMAKTSKQSSKKNLAASSKSKSSSKATIYLLDISSFIFRAFYALPLLNNPQGTPTNAVYGVANMLLKLLNQEDPKYFVALQDSKEETFRNQLDKNYKANREAPPEELKPQFALIDELLDRLHIKRFREPGYEADDLIGTLSKRALKEKYEVVIVSGDKDLMQLVGKGIRIFDPQKDKWYEDGGVIEKLGVKPDQVTDYLALVGDSIDNIPGVPGIGPKTAVNLISEFGSIEDLYKNIDQLKKSKRKESLIENEKNARLSKELATVHCQVEFEHSFDEFGYKFQPDDKLKDFFKTMGFSKLTDRVFGETAVDDPSPMKSSKKQFFKTVVVNTKKQLQDLAKELEGARAFAVDTETNSLDALNAKLVGISIGKSGNKAYYIPIAHQGEGSERQLDLESVRKALQPVLSSINSKKIFQNGKFDLHVLKNAGFEGIRVDFDTMIAAHVLDSSYSSYSMDELSKKFLDYEPTSYEAVVGKGSKQICFDQVPMDVAAPYAAEDGWVTYRLFTALKDEMKSVTKLFEKIEMPTLSILAEMEEVGVKIDKNYLSKLSKELEKRLGELTAEIHSEVGEEFNIASPKQLQVVLFEKLGLPTSRKTKTGFSTDVKVLEELSRLDQSGAQVPRMILEYRELAKLKSTYVDVLPGLVSEKTHRLHTSFNQVGAATGRLSSSDPNLQNIPIKTELGRKIRKGFVPEKGCVFLSCDYSQVELRILAHLSEDKTLIESFKNGEDVHTRTAAEVFECEESEVNSQLRREAKAINFGLIYGQTAYGLSQQLGVARNQAAQYIEKYFERYPGVKKFLNDSVERAKKKGYAETMFGRRRSLPDIKAKNFSRRQFAERIAINTPVQGTAAEMMKLSMIHVQDEIKEMKFKSKMILQVHDEMLFEVPKDELQELSEVVVNKMEKIFPDFRVPLKVDANHGPNWMEVK
jgi:DNA polymerase-1